MLNTFPPCPIQGTPRLKPLRSWLELHGERRLTRVEYDQFWDEAVHDGVAYFFRWLNKPRATVLVVWDGKRLSHVEGRKVGDVPLSKSEEAQILSEVAVAFARAGFKLGKYRGRS